MLLILEVRTLGHRETMGGVEALVFQIPYFPASFNCSENSSNRSLVSLRNLCDLANCHFSVIPFLFYFPLCFW